MDMIAVLDGIGIDPSASGGANYSGGSSWASGFPTYPSSEGLAGYMDAFDGLSGFQADAVNPSASGGANYSGGSSWAPGFPTYPSSEGLAMAPQGYDVSRVNPSASGGANYSGGSSWAPGFPTYPSTNGLAAAERIAASDPGTAFATAYRTVLSALRTGTTARLAPRLATIVSYMPGGTRVPADEWERYLSRARSVAGEMGPEMAVGAFFAKLTHFAENTRYYSR